MALNVSLDLTGPFTEDHGHRMGHLIEELAPLCQVPDYNGPLHVIVLPKESIPELINQILVDGVYKAGPHTPSAVAIPTVVGDTLHCFILLASEEVAELNEDCRSAFLVSSFLEELLHVRIYATRWNMFSYLDPPDLSERQKAIYQVGRGMHDEYIVCRAKTQLAAYNLLFDTPDQPNSRTTVLLRYGGDVVASLESASETLGDLSDRLPFGRFMSDIALHEMLTVLYRRILEPLARDAGFRDGTPSDVSQEAIDLSTESEFYRDWLLTHWPPMLTQLRHSYDSGLDQMGTILLSLNAMLEALVKDIDENARA